MRATQMIQLGALEPIGMKTPERKRRGRMVALTIAGEASAFGYCHKERTSIVATMALRAAAALIAPGVASVAMVTTHKATVRIAQTRPKTFDARLIRGASFSEL